jgi:hypothetical protein
MTDDEGHSKEGDTDNEDRLESGQSGLDFYKLPLLL